ncbi:MAG: AraC family transcriptional regulator [Pseudomonadota bacterium]
MDLATTSFRLLGASQQMLFLLVLLSSSNPLRVRTVGGVLLLGSIIYLVGPLIIEYARVDSYWLFHVFPSMIPAMTMLFVWVVFEERLAIPQWLIGLVLLDFGLTIWLEPDVIGDEGRYGAVLAQLLKIFLACAAIYLVWLGREDDLIEMRLKARLWFVGCLSLTVLGVAILEVMRIYSIVLPGEALGFAWIFLLTLGINYSFIKLNPTANLVGAPESPPAPETTSDPLVTSMLERMTEERLYADHDLRVGSLADVIGIPEYQLRKKINQSLGFRNFNQFVNQYRIQEASQRLLSEPRTPVLTVALDVGFRSVSSFNTAFQAHHGVSATVFRAQNRTDS